MEPTRRNLLIGGSLLGAVVAGGLRPSACAMNQILRGSPKMTDSAPKRLHGQAKPVLEEDIAPVLARLDAWYAAHLRPDKYVFNPPATDAQLDAFEQLVGVKMPSSYRQLYKWHDGENDDRWGHIYGLPILPLKRAAEEHQQWRRTLAAFGGNPYPVRGGAWPEGAVDSAYVNPGWIPLTADGSSNHIGLDFDPWPGGRVGQIIVFGRNEDVKVVLGESLGKFLEWIAGLLESANFQLTVRSDQVLLRLFRLKQPDSDGFHEGARMILGAPGQFL